MSETKPKIALVLSSVRTPRVGPSAVNAVHDALKKSPEYSKVDVTIIDVASFNLPIFNEKVAPAMVPTYAQFEHEHSKKFSAAFQPYDGYIWVSPEYNGGVPGGAKNAIDYLYNEWIGKPIFIVAYGIHGGHSASLALRDIFEVMKLRVIPTRPLLKFSGDHHNGDLTPAMTQGVLGPDSTKAWSESEEVVHGFEELLEFVNDKEKKGTRFLRDKLGLP